ncbi:MAG: Zn-dependent hydrolase [Bacteroidales bacterium]|nr:Zn-dependent hydrolase [Bacteroidales bacterium]
MKSLLSIFLLLIVSGTLTSCKLKTSNEYVANDTISMKLNDFAPVELKTDISKLTAKEKQLIAILIEVADIMDEIFWMEAYGDKDTLIKKLRHDDEIRLINIHYGPWDRMAGNAPFFRETGPKPPGANFYPADMTIEEFEKLGDTRKTNLYTLIRRNEQAELTVIPYHQAFREKVQQASILLTKAAMYAEDPGLRRYLELRAKAFMDDDYRASDLAWMDMKTNTIDFVVGPIETYEDQLFGYKASHEAYLLVKDTLWSRRLNQCLTLLPALQQSLPVDNRYKLALPVKSSDLGVYDVIYYAGECKAGSKTIAINLPNDKYVQQVKGSRRVQLKNAIQAKFDNIMVPIAREILAPEHLPDLTFDAFFTNTMFHEIAHGLGPANTISGNGSIREALMEYHTTIEEGKADVVGVYLIDRLREIGKIELNTRESYTTFVAGIFRSIRFGASNAHGKANLIRYNYFMESGAISRDSLGFYHIHYEKTKEAVHKLSALLLKLQGDGNYQQAEELLKKYATISPLLKADLERISRKNVPVDICFEQGLAILGINK